MENEFIKELINERTNLSIEFFSLSSPLMCFYNAITEISNKKAVFVENKL